MWECNSEFVVIQGRDNAFEIDTFNARPVLQPKLCQKKSFKPKMAKSWPKIFGRGFNYLVVKSFFLHIYRVL